MNAIQVIQPYRFAGTWVFDDAAAGLEKEPFVAGIPELIDRLVTGIPSAENGFRLLFAAAPFPGWQEHLTWLREEYDGNWYHAEKFAGEGWLCPALFKYFDVAPQHIYVRAEALQGGRNG
jgi:hypothetical protein